MCRRLSESVGREIFQNLGAELFDRPVVTGTYYNHRRRRRHRHHHHHHHHLNKTQNTYV